VLRRVIAPDGVSLAVDVWGAGPPLVMVHGAGSGKWGFDFVRPLLEPRFTVWAVDRRGRGDSGDSEGYSLEKEFEDVAAVVRDAGDGALLFGHSFGGLVSAGAAGRLERLERLVLYEAPMGGVLPDEEWQKRFEAHLAAGDPDSAVRLFLHDVGGYSHVEIDVMEGTPAWRQRLAAAPRVPREVRAERELATDDLGLERLELACLLLVGSESPDWAHRSTEAFAAAIPGARVRILEGQGHGAAVSAPALLTAELERFLLQPPRD
jgi:pimeloyl-ACP methyl ester carboxylesterase